jgi:hypothetical protein
MEPIAFGLSQSRIHFLLNAIERATLLWFNCHRLQVLKLASGFDELRILSVILMNRVRHFAVVSQFSFHEMSRSRDGIGDQRSSAWPTITLHKAPVFRR